MLTTRLNLPFLLNGLNFKTGVEVGVWRGEFAEHILQYWGGHLTLVDCWQPQPVERYHDIMNQSQEIQDKCFLETTRRMEKFPGRYKIIKGFSLNIATKFAAQGDMQFDFIYFDANHHYKAISQDLAAWYPLIRGGGLVSGHDYLDGEANNTTFGVKKAVDEFVLDKKISNFFVTNEVWPTWGFIKDA
jgi:hypothetical protein